MELLERSGIAPAISGAAYDILSAEPPCAGMAALLILSGAAAEKQGLMPKARIVAMAVAGVEPRIMGIGPVPAVRKVLARAGLDLNQMDLPDGSYRA